MSDLIPNDHIKLLAEIKERIRTALRCVRMSSDTFWSKLVWLSTVFSQVWLSI